MTYQVKMKGETVAFYHVDSADKALAQWARDQGAIALGRDEDARGVTPLELPAMIRAMRKGKGWTMAQAGAALGVSASCICRWESGARAPLDKHKPALLEVFGIAI